MLKIFLPFLVFSCKSVHGNLKEDITKRINRINNEGKRLYGDIVRTEWTVWELENDDMNGYPRGDKQKKALFLRQWLAYYECTVRQLDTLLPWGRLPSQFVAVYEGAVSRLQCSACVAPGAAPPKWEYAQSLKDLTFNDYEEDQNTVRTPEGLMSMYSTHMSNAFVYRCSNTSLLILHVTNKPYSMVKPHSSEGPYTASTVNRHNVSAFTKWGPWSECSRCDVVGRRRRYGMCYVSLKIEENKPKIWESDVDIFKDFPGGIPCGSEYLPKSIRDLRHVKDRKNEIMLAMCKVPCVDKIFELRLPDGRVLERDNNSAGQYSLLQHLPPQPPMPVAIVLFVDSGDALDLTCPGTAFIDAPLTWRVGTKIASPQALERDSNGQIYIDARDRIVFTKLKAEDANVYSCWIGSQALGTVKLHVWSGPQRRLERDTVMIMIIIFLVNIMSLLRCAVKSAKRDLTCEGN